MVRKKTDDLKTLQQRLALRELEIDIFFQFSKTHWTALDVHTISHHLFRLVSRRLELQALSLFLLQEETPKLIVTSYTATPPGMTKAMKQGSVREYVKKAGIPIKPDSVTVVPLVIPRKGKTRLAPQHRATHHVHHVPLTILDRTVGVLGLVSPGRGPLVPEDLQFVDIMVGEVAMLVENQRIQSAMVRERNLLISILQSMTCAVLVVDAHQNVMMSNPLANAIFGMRADRIVGRPLREVIQLDNIISLFATTAQQANEYMSLDVEIPNAAQGRPMSVRANLAKVRNRAGNIVGVVLVLNDISREKEIERVRMEFVSVASHELRTPMAAIREAVSLVLDGVTGDVNDKQRKFLDMAQRNIDRLTGIINDLLDLSKIESGKLQLTCASVNPHDIVDDVFATFEAAAREKGISLLKGPHDGLPKIVVDRDKMDQVLGNLVSNAIKFTPTGGMITIDAKMSNVRERSVAFLVKDTGIGIERKDYAKLFQKFTQLDSSLSRTAGGTGLGLAISKEIVELHGGRIWVESETGHGTTFHVVVPIKTREAARKRYILTVTSDRELEGMARDILERNHYEVGHAFRGAEALPSIQEVRPDLILLDIALPDMDGFELCRQLKEDPETALIPIVVLTVAGQESAVWKALSLGVSGYLVRPMDAKAVLSTVKEVVR